jgi:hypothetical protein
MTALEVIDGEGGVGSLKGCGAPAVLLSEIELCIVVVIGATPAFEVTMPWGVCADVRVVFDNVVWVDEDVWMDVAGMEPAEDVIAPVFIVDVVDNTRGFVPDVSTTLDGMELPDGDAAVDMMPGCALEVPGADV